MVCKQCGHTSQGDYGVCPYCGNVTKPKNNKAIFVTIAVLCVLLVVGCVAFFIVVSGKMVKNDIISQSVIGEQLTERYADLQESATGENSVVPDVTVPTLSKEPIAENPQAEPNSKADADSIVHSSEIGMVNGKIYAVDNVGRVKNEQGYYTAYSDNPVIPRLPVQEGEYLGEFCVYDDYVYYTMGGNGDPWCTYYLYRCKTDFSDHQLLLKTESEEITGYDDSVYPIRVGFMIVNNKLYSDMGTNGDGVKRQYVDLKTLQTSSEIRPDIEAMYGVDNGIVFVWSDQVFVYDFETCAIKQKTGETFKTIIERDTAPGYFGGIYGFVDGWLYYSEDIAYSSSDTPSYNALLYRVRVSDGETEVVDKCMAGGGSNYFHR